jgi:O-antigen/teichoic acid export membrane protein
MASQTRKITLDTAALVFGRMVGFVLGLIRLNYLARLLGVANFGVLNFATYFTSLFGSLFDLGLSQLLTREIARDVSRSRELLGRVLLLKLVITATASLLVTAIAFAAGFTGETLTAVLLTTVALAVNQLAATFLSALQAHRRMALVSAANIINDAVLSAAIILVLPGSPLVTTALVITAAISLLNLTLLVAVYRRLVGTPIIRADMKAARMFLREGIPIAVASLGISVYTFVGPTILKFTRGEAEVGLFSSGFKVITILSIIPTALTQVLFPIYSEFFAHTREKLEKALADSLRVITLVSIPLAAGALIVGNDLFRLLYTEEYLPGVIVMQVILLGNVLGFMDWVLYAFLLSGNRQAFLMRLSLAAGVGAALLSLILVPRYGYLALPFLTAGIETLLFVIQIVYVRSIGYRRLWLRSLWRPVAAALVMAGTLLLLGSLPVLARILLGAAVYGVALYAVRGLGEQERAILQGLISRASPGKIPGQRSE